MSAIKTSIIILLTVLILAQSASGSELPQVTGLTQLTDSTANEYDASWSPDDTSIVYIVDGSTHKNLRIMDLDGSSETSNFCKSFLLHPDWGQDGILYITKDSDPRIPLDKIYITNNALTNSVQLTDITNIKHPSWNNDCTKILFLRLINYNYEIWTIDPDGTNAAGLSDFQTTLDSPCWSPDATKIAFSADNDIWVIDADGNNVIQLTNDSFTQSFPTWGPDGEFIAYTSNENRQNDIWIMRSDGTDKTLFISESRELAHPDWSHDSTKLMYTSYQNGNGDIWVANVLIPVPTTITASGPVITQTVDIETKTNILRLIILAAALVLSALVLLFMAGIVIRGLKNRSHRNSIHHHM